ncbi:hypothetical protein, partial [Sutterella sp.]|uniref:phage integrase central domain-containing protein n=1 Tax=Sutterella sp. TaxID=1981025 RepID=UPI0026DEE361
MEDAKEKTIVIRKMWSDGIGLDEIKERIKVQKANESLEEYVNRIWERHSEEKGYKNPATLKNQMYALNKHVFTYFKGRAMRAINENDIREFLENLNARIPRSASNVGYLLKEIFDYAIRDGVYKRLNPVV